MEDAPRALAATLVAHTLATGVASLAIAIMQNATPEAAAGVAMIAYSLVAFAVFCGFLLYEETGRRLRAVSWCAAFMTVIYVVVVIYVFVFMLLIRVMIDGCICSVSDALIIVSAASLASMLTVSGVSGTVLLIVMHCRKVQVVDMSLI